MESARSETTGVATGGVMNNSGLWGQIFGADIDQGKKDNVEGYQANVGGFAIGGDTLVNSQLRVGGAFAYSTTDAEGIKNNTDIDSYQGSVYASYDAGKVYYEGLAAITFNSYDTDRTLFDNSVAKGDFDGTQYSLKGAVGYNLDVNNGWKVTPFVSAQYTLISQDTYSETGSNANLTINSDDVNVFKTGLGAKGSLSYHN